MDISRHGTSILRSIFGTFLLGFCIFWGSSSFVFASTIVDRKFQLETIGALRSIDNIDGLLAAQLNDVYSNYLAQQSRFVYVDLTKADFFFEQSKLPYPKAIEDREILARLSRSAHLNSLIRTRVLRRNRSYRFLVEWLVAPQMELMAQEEFIVDEPSPGTAWNLSQFSAEVEKHLANLFSKVPFFGGVTGRERGTITVNLGRVAGLKKGDILSISTLERVKVHPLLHKVVDWKFSLVGKLQVEQVEDRIAFCSVLDEKQSLPISKLQKVTQIDHSQDSPASSSVTVLNSSETSDRSPASVATQSTSEQGEQPERNSAPIEQYPPRLGWVGGTLVFGGYSWQYSSGQLTNVGGGLDLGSELNAQLWLTRNWFLGLDLGYSFFGFSQQNQATGALTPASQKGGVGGSASTFKLAGGYSHLFTSDFFGPKAWIQLGVKSVSFSLPTSTTENTGATSFNTVFLGVGGDLPLFTSWGLLANLNYRLFTSVSQNWITGSAISASDSEIYLGGYYRLGPQFTVRAGLEILNTGVNYSSGISLSQNTVTFSPSILYYF